MRETVEKKFADASMFTFSTGTSHLSTVKQDGEEVPCEDANFPYEIILVPNRDAFPKEDMEEGEDMLDFFEKWSDGTDNGKVKTRLFTVKARHDPSDDRPVDRLPGIGAIQLTSELYRSTFGDTRLFFQHETITRDMNILHKQGDEGVERAMEWK